MFGNPANKENECLKMLCDCLEPPQNSPFTIIVDSKKGLSHVQNKNEISKKLPDVWPKITIISATPTESDNETVKRDGPSISHILD